MEGANDMAEHIELDKVYLMDGKDIAALLQVAFRLNNGHNLNRSERAQSARTMKEALDRRVLVSSGKGN
jgi:hypothetical protein